MRVPKPPPPGATGERLTPLEKAARNPGSRSLAIRAKCWDCSGGDADPGVRARVRDCPSKTCPLWPLRPWQNAHGRSGYVDDPEDPGEDADVEEDPGDG